MSLQVDFSRLPERNQLYPPNGLVPKESLFS